MVQNKLVGDAQRTQGLVIVICLKLILTYPVHASKVSVVNLVDTKHVNAPNLYVYISRMINDYYLRQSIWPLGYNFFHICNIFH